jgi:KDO2-lipid IV(A) lauroyltransferase
MKRRCAGAACERFREAAKGRFVSLRRRALGRLAATVPTRKLAATRSFAVDARLVHRGGESALLRANAAFVWSYYWRFARLASGPSRERLLKEVTAIGDARLRAAVRRDRGVILLSVHLGDFDVAGAWLAAKRGLTPVVVSRRLEPRWREAAFSSTRRRCGVVVRDAADTSLAELEDDLGQRRVVLAMLDRRPSGPGATSVMLGRPAVAPAAISVLAARTGASLLPAATWRDGRGSTVAWFGEPFTVAGEATGNARVVAAAEQLGRLIRAHPDQWHVPRDLSQMAWSPGATTGSADLGIPSGIEPTCGDSSVVHVQGLSWHGLDSRPAYKKA